MIAAVAKAAEYLSARKLYVKNSLLYLFSAVFSAAIAIAVNPLLASNLSPEDYAVLGYFNSFSVFVLPILNFSLISYYLRNYYRFSEERREIVRDTILIALSVWGLVSLLFVLGAFFLYFGVAEVKFPFYPYALLTFLPLYFNNFLTLYQIDCRLKREAGSYCTITLVNAASSTALAVVFVVFYNYGATGRLLATLLASIATAVYCFARTLKKLRFDPAVVKEAVRFGWPVSLSALLWYFLSGVDGAMLERLNDSNTFGFYNVAVQITGYLTVCYTAIAQTFEPDIYKAIAADDKRKILKFSCVIILLNSIPNLLFICFAPFIMAILTNNIYTDASSFARILALKNITVSLYFLSVALVVGYGFTRSELLTRVIGSAVCFLMFKYLIGNYGFYGAAWGQAASFLITSLISVCYLFCFFNRLHKSPRVS